MIKIINILIYSLLAILPFGQLTRLPIPHPNINLYLHDILISFIIILWLTTKPKKLPSLAKPIALFISACLISLILAIPRFQPQQLLVSSLYLIRWTAYAGLYFVLKDKRIKLPLYRLMVFSSLALAIFGLTQYLLVPDTRFLAAAHWDDHYYRVIATLGDPAFVGIILLLGLILAITAKFPVWLYPVYLIPLLLTYSRSTYLSLVAAAVAYSFFKRRFKMFVFALLALAIVLTFLPRPGGEGVKLERLASISQRAENYREGIAIFKKSPIFGVGFNTLRFYRQDQVSHAAAGLDSSLLFILATTGLVGLIAYLNLLKNLWRKSIAITISLVALLIHSFFQNTLFYPWVMIWFWILLATEYS